MEVLSTINRAEASMKNITTIGIDLAKQVFQVHGVNARGKVVLKKAIRRQQMFAFFAGLPPCLIGLEACGSAHYWARSLTQFGHTVKLMAPQFVKPYVKTNKNDQADAEAICEAVIRPNMRFVPVKTVAQQTVLSLHRVRQSFVKARTAQSNQLRGLLAEFGLVIPPGISQLPRTLPGLLEDADNGLPDSMRDLLARLWAHFKQLHQHVLELEAQIKAWHRQSPASQKLAQVPGIGPLTATALVASIGNARDFRNGRQLAAWLGLVPKQHSTGGKPVLLGISKRGDRYLRTLLIHGARAALLAAQRHADKAPLWLMRLQQRRHHNIVAVALANKNARIVWALLAHDRCYEADYVSKVKVA
jgi:transposase